MSVSTTTTEVEYTGNGVATTFPVPFPFFEAGDLAVTVNGVTQAFTVTGDPRTAAASVVISPAVTGTILIRRDMDMLQPTTFGLQGTFSPKAHEAAFDRGVMLVQGVARNAADALAAEVAVLEAADAAEAAARIAADNAEIATRAAAVASEASARSTGDAVEAAARAAADAAIIASGAEPANVSLAPVVVGSQTHTVHDWLELTRTIYLDSVAGNDANDGYSAATPVQTMDAAYDLMSAGCRLLVARGSRFSFPVGAHGLFPLLPDMEVDAYGIGPKPIFEIASIISGAWTQDPDHANVWFKDVTHAVPVTAGSSYTAVGPHFRLYFEPTEVGFTQIPYDLQPYFGGASIADNRAYVAANEGRFTCHRTGSTTPNPTTQAGSFSQFTYYVALKDGMDPNTVGVQMTHAEYSSVGIGAFRKISNIVFRRNMTKEWGTGNGGGQFVNCEFRDMAGHGMLGPFHHLGSYSTAHETSYAFGCGCYHAFLGTPGVPPSRGVLIEDSTAVNFGVGVYSHGAGGAYEHEMFIVKNFTAIDCKSVFRTDGAKWSRIRGVKAINCYSLCGGGNATIEDFYFSGRAAGTAGVAGAVFGLYAGAVVRLKNGIIAMDPAIGAVEGQANYLWQSSAGTPAVLELDNVQILDFYMGTVDQTHPWGNVKLIARNSIVAAHENFGDKFFFVNLVASDSMLRIGSFTLEHIQSVYNTAGDDVANTCFTPYQIQTFSREIVAGDLAYKSTTRKATATSGNTYFTVDYNDVVRVGSWIKIVNADGAGADWTGQVLSIVGGPGSAQANVAAAFAYNVTNKEIQVGYFASKVWPAAAGAAGTATFDGTTGVKFSVPGHFAAGTRFYVNPVNRRRNYWAGGSRKVVTYDPVTGIGVLDAGINLRHPGVRDTSWYKTLDSASGYVPRDPVDITFGYPITTRMTQAGVTYPYWVHLWPDGVTEVTTLTADVGGQFPSFANYKSDGSASAFKTINLIPGEVDAGFEVCPGSVLTVKAIVLDDDLFPSFTNEPHDYPCAYEKGSYFDVNQIARVQLGKWPFLAGG